MDFLTMNVSAGFIILTTIYVRKLTMEKVPQIVIWFSWSIALLRLCVPFSVRSEFSIFNLFHKIRENPKLDFDTILPLMSNDFVNLLADAEVSVESVSLDYSMIFCIIWFSCAVFVAEYFISSFFQGFQIIKRARVMQNDTFIRQCIQEVGFWRPVVVKESIEIDSPVSYGVFKLYIIFPSRFPFQNQNLVRHVLLHECMHLKFFHSLFKYLMVGIVIIYWFNPFVWLMLDFIQRDMEITCDKNVVKRIGLRKRNFYAKDIVNVAGGICNSNGSLVFNYYFRINKITRFFMLHRKHKLKDVVKERVVAIMNFKKVSGFALTLSLVLPMSMSTVFATTDMFIDGQEVQGNIVIKEPGNESMEYTSETIEVTMEEISGSLVQPHTGEIETKAPSYLVVENYQYISYGSSPTSLKASLKEGGYTYSGTLYRGSYAYDAKLDKYVGNYSGTLYR